ncbi:hypothetical protein I6E11_03520 [Bacteroides caecigallinarum]|uniref:hypothetical protein n=1 Tax=Bacteroides caecigallinarum TaxID=1411144 RepID=UPI001F238130|nr:hypothetical protein [Bacteroides caecigallinarum]MCF2592887.1 hypothetical protein [Bacteroides caecigallinarum]
MTTLDMTQVVGLQAVDAEGNVIGTLSVNDLTELVAKNLVESTQNQVVAARSVSTLSEASTLAASDDYENTLPIDANPASVRTLDADGNPKQTAISSLAQVVGGLITNTNFVYASSSDTAVLYKLNIKSWDKNLIFEVVGEGNSNKADIFLVMSQHYTNRYCYNKNQQGNTKFYGDNVTPTQLYIYVPAYSKFIVRFINRVPADNTITLEDVTSTVSTSDLVEL